MPFLFHSRLLRTAAQLMRPTPTRVCSSAMPIKHSAQTWFHSTALEVSPLSPAPLLKPVLFLCASTSVLVLSPSLPGGEVHQIFWAAVPKVQRGCWQQVCVFPSVSPPSQWSGIHLWPAALSEPEKSSADFCCFSPAQRKTGLERKRWKRSFILCGMFTVRL